MNGKPINAEQLEAEVESLCARIPVVAIVMPPREWLIIITQLQLAYRCPDLPPALQQSIRLRVEKLIQVFPPHLVETHRMFEQGWTNRE